MVFLPTDIYRAALYGGFSNPTARNIDTTSHEHRQRVRTATSTTSRPLPHLYKTHHDSFFAGATLYEPEVIIPSGHGLYTSTAAMVITLGSCLFSKNRIRIHWLLGGLCCATLYFVSAKYHRQGNPVYGHGVAAVLHLLTFCIYSYRHFAGHGHKLYLRACMAGLAAGLWYDFGRYRLCAENYHFLVCDVGGNMPSHFKEFFNESQLAEKEEFKDMPTTLHAPSSVVQELHRFRKLRTIDDDFRARAGQ